MVLVYAVGSDKWLKPLTTLDVANYVVDMNATDDMAETASKSLMDSFLQMGTKSGGWTPETAPHYSRSPTSKAHKISPNWYLCTKICMIWEATTKGEYKYD